MRTAVKNDFIRVRVEHKLKAHVHKTFEKLGITPTQVITMLYKHIEREKKIPITLALYNAETRKAIKEAKKGVGIDEHDSVDDYFKKMDININAKDKN